MKSKTLILVIVFLYIFNLSAQESDKKIEWTIRKDTPLLWDTYQAKGDAYLELKTIPRGSKVYPLAHKTLVYFKVELPSGEYGYVNYLDINDSYWVTNPDSVEAYKGDVYKSEFDVLPPNTRAYVMKVVNSGVYNIRIKDGRIRNVSRHKMYSPFFDSLPEVSQGYFKIYTFKKLEKMLIGEDVSAAYKKLGTADALVYKSTDRSISEIFFSHVIAVEDQKRHKGIKLISQNNKIEKIEIVGGAKKAIAERLPLAGLIHSINLNNIFHGNKNYFIEENSKTLMDFFSGKGWFIKVIGIIVYIIVLFLFFAIPQFLSWPIRRLISAIKFLGNGMVIFLNFLILTFFVYLFFLALNIYIVIDQFIFMLIFTLIPWFIFIKRNRSKILYNRCPRCRTMWSAVDKGSTYKGKSKSKTWKTRDEYSHTSGNTKYYKRHLDEEITTTKHYDDHRRCQRCGYDWDVERDESSTTTIRH